MAYDPVRQSIVQLTYFLGLHSRAICWGPDLIGRCLVDKKIHKESRVRMWRGREAFIFRLPSLEPNREEP
jgi:hypothetical protein